MTAAIKLDLSPGAPLLHFALDYASRGWHVFPCKPENKAPYTNAGFKEASIDETTIRRWWQQWPNAMIGVRMGAASDFWALDPDAPDEHGKPDGCAKWEELKAAHGCPHTHTHLTPGGGEHLLFRWRDDRRITNREGKLSGTGINVRGEGGYIIAPPSVRFDGKAYEIAESFDIFNIANAPEWLYDLILAEKERPSISQQALANVRPIVPVSHRAYAEKAMAGECNRVLSAPRGSRNNFLNIAAVKLGSLVAANELSESEVIDSLFDAASSAGLVNEDGRKIVMATINSGLRKGLEQPRVIPELNANIPLAPMSDADQVRPPIDIFWHGQDYNRETRPWLVREMVPQTGQGLASGQWGAAKTFAMIDLAAAVMTATTFAGRQADRRGGVLFIAAEGAGEIPIRLQGVVEQKLRPSLLAAAAGGEGISADLERLPFAWIEECPSLRDEAGLERLVDLAKRAGSCITEQFNLPLALIIVDTLSAAADFEDANAAAEGQRVMNKLNALSRRTGAFVLAVDHFGKVIETGTRGTSAKEAAADVVLALLADRDVSGTISNTRLAIRKLRGGATGAETAFDLKVVEISPGETTCIIEWKADHQGTSATSTKNRWSPALRIFKSALNTALAEHGTVITPYGNEGAAQRAAPVPAVRSEFMAAYPSAATDGAGKSDAKRVAFNRSLKTARERELIGSREIGGIDHLWLVEPSG